MESFMKKIISIVIFVWLVSFLCGYGYATVYARTNTDEIDYMDMMIRCYLSGNNDALEEAIRQRNIKIADNNLNYQIVDADEFISNFQKFSGFDPDKDYTMEIVNACLDSDVSIGRKLVYERNKKIKYIGGNHREMDFDEVLLLSKVIQHEAGSNWLPIDWKMKVGEVLLNRVDSPEFPNTLYECVYAKGQYSGSVNNVYDSLTPSTESVIAAIKLLNGERILDEKSVVFQSNRPQGGKVYEVLSDSILGNTYLCCSYNIELYKEE